MRIWLDDIRPMPNDYDIHFKSSTHLNWFLSNNCNKVSHISFDHDLGEKINGTGYLVVLYLEFLAYSGILQNKFTWEVHSSNPVGRNRIIQGMKKMEEYLEKNKT